MSTFQLTASKDAYGPHTDEVVYLVELLATLTPAQASQIEGWHLLDVPRLPSEVREHVWAVRDKAAPRTVLLAAMRRAADATCTAAREVPEIDKNPDAWMASITAAENAALALVIRDVLDLDVYRLLAGPVADVFGPIHPDDVAKEEE